MKLREVWDAIVRESFRTGGEEGFRCCPAMDRATTARCQEHVDSPRECADVLIWETGRGLALPVRDGGGAFFPINFCPWCGKVVR